MTVTSTKGQFIQATTNTRLLVGMEIYEIVFYLPSSIKCVSTLPLKAASKKYGRFVDSF